VVKLLNKEGKGLLRYNHIEEDTWLSISKRIHLAVWL